jgi:hypothetical protein
MAEISEPALTLKANLACSKCGRTPHNLIVRNALTYKTDSLFDTWVIQVQETVMKCVIAAIVLLESTVIISE